MTGHFEQNILSSPKSRSAVRILRRELTPTKTGDTTRRTQPGQTSRTETFLTILAERYLKFKEKTSACPFEDQIRALRLLTKHLHSGFLKFLIFETDFSYNCSFIGCEKS